MEVTPTLQQPVDYQLIHNLQNQFVYAAHVPKYGYFMDRPHTPAPQPIPNANYGFSQPNPNWPQQFRPTIFLPQQTKTCDFPFLHVSPVPLSP